MKHGRGPFGNFKGKFITLLFFLRITMSSDPYENIRHALFTHPPLASEEREALSEAKTVDEMRLLIASRVGLVVADALIAGFSQEGLEIGPKAEECLMHMQRYTMNLHLPDRDHPILAFQIALLINRIGICLATELREGVSDEEMWFHLGHDWKNTIDETVALLLEEGRTSPPQEDDDETDED